MDVFDFKFTEEEMAELRSLDTGKGQHNPDAEGVGEMLLSAYVIDDPKKV